MPKIKIFVSYKDKHKTIKSDIITPIQTGRAIAEEVFEGMIGDDTGDNISVLNNRFCETTAIYWVWKNYEQIDNPDYIGFMHYRRHFLYGEKNYNTNYYGLVKYEKLNQEYLEENITDENIKNIVEKYDVIIPRRITNFEINGLKNNYKQYKKSHNIDDLDKALNILTDKYPEYKKYVEEYKNSNYAYYLNMFIMRKDIFFEYCNWLFSILFELRYTIIPTSDNYQNRVIGFISERLTDIFFRKLYDDKYRMKELPISYIECVEENSDIEKSNLGENNIIPIVFSTNFEFFPYLSVCLQSIKDNINSNYKYEINILERGLTPNNKNFLKNQMSSDNFVIKFYNVEKLLEKFSSPQNLQHISVDTYSRFFIPSILNAYEKCIYLDGDTIVRDDLAKLYQTPLNGKTIGASVCAVISAWTNIDKEIKDYINKTIGISDNSKYFQAGVLILNLKKMRENNSQEKLIELASKKKWKFADQDILNKLYKDDVQYIDMAWNYEYEHSDMRKAQYKEMMPLSILQEYINAKKNPKIIHFQGQRKPWLWQDEEFASIWWNYARKSSLYEQFIVNMIDNRKNYQMENIKLYKKYKFKFLKYKILRNVFWGKIRKKYIIKKNVYKDKLIEIKRLIGNL